jgi:hypothetical protein
MDQRQTQPHIANNAERRIYETAIENNIETNPAIPKTGQILFEK